MSKKFRSRAELIEFVASLRIPEDRREIVESELLGHVEARVEVEALHHPPPRAEERALAALGTPRELRRELERVESSFVFGIREAVLAGLTLGVRVLLIGAAFFFLYGATTQWLYFRAVDLYRSGHESLAWVLWWFGPFVAPALHLAVTWACIRGSVLTLRTRLRRARTNVAPLVFAGIAAFLAAVPIEVAGRASDGSFADGSALVCLGVCILLTVLTAQGALRRRPAHDHAKAE